MNKHIVHLHSSEDGKIPDPKLLETGEIAVNNAAGNEGLFIKNTNGLIVKVGGDFSGLVQDLSYKSATSSTFYSKRETANCYVIDRPGYYKFPLVYGNAIKNDEINTAAFTNGGGQYQADFVNYIGFAISSPFIETDSAVAAESAQLLLADENNIIDDIEIIDGDICRFIRFHVIRVPDTGANAIIGLLDYHNEVLWSWHIWLWKDNLSPVTIRNYDGNEYKILPVNLASKYDSDGIHLKNWFYQWGRKDPFPCSYKYDDDNEFQTYGTLQFSVISSAAINVTESITNPCTFYISDNHYNYNWVSLNYFYNYWDSTCDATGFTEKTVVKTVYDPCPRGFCIPNARVFTGFTTTGQTSSTISEFNVNGDWNSGWNFKTADGGSVFFPASGYRISNDGSLSRIGITGLYWSSGAVSATDASVAAIGSDSVNQLASSYRAQGSSVRPVAI